MMDQLGNIGDFIGGIGVVVTLAYLALQIKQNTNQLKLDSATALQTGLAQAYDPVYQSGNMDSFQKALAGELLQAAEKLTFQFIMFRILTQLEMTYEYVARDAANPAILRKHDSAVMFLLASPGGLGYWESVGRGVFRGEFGEHVESLVQVAERYPAENKIWQQAG